MRYLRYLLYLLLVISGWLFMGTALVLFCSSVIACLIGWDKFLPIMQYSMVFVVFEAGVFGYFFLGWIFALDYSSLWASLQRNPFFRFFFYYVVPPLVFGFGCCVISAIVLGPQWMVLSGIYAIGFTGGWILIPVLFYL